MAILHNWWACRDSLGTNCATQDVDISLLAGFGDETAYVDPLLESFAGRIKDAGEFALANRVILASASNGIALDIVLAGFPFEELAIDRATSFEFAPGLELTTASAEDLVVMKAFAGRDRDWSDVRGILKRQANLDWEYIRPQLEQVCQLRDDTQTMAKLEAMRQEESD